MAKIDKIFYLLPEKVVEKLPLLEEHLRDLPGFRLSNLKEILSIIALYTRNDKNKWIPLKMTHLRKLVPGAEHYLDTLRILGIIERGGSYKPGITAYKYRWASEYFSKFQREVVEDMKLVRRIKTFNGSLAKIQGKNSMKYPEQNKYIRALSIDPGALNVIADISQIGSYNYALASAYRIMNRDITYSVDKTACRYHSNLTNTPSILRPFIRINGTPLVNIDISNSQPYLSILFLTNPCKVARFAKGRKFSMMPESLQVNQTEDVKRWIALVISGQLYEHLQSEFARRGSYLSRNQTKLITMKIMFSKNRHSNKHRTIFAELFPEIHRVFTIIRGNRHERFPILLQRIEAHLVLGVIIKRISKEYPDIITVTIHDSILTGQDDAELVREIMTEELTRFVGYPPRLKVEHYKSKINDNEIKQNCQTKEKRVHAGVP